MPLYDFKCNECGEEFEDISPASAIAKAWCPQCKEVKDVTVLITKANKDWFVPHINDDFDGTPIEVTSRKHLRELCKKHGVYSRALD